MVLFISLYHIFVNFSTDLAFLCLQRITFWSVKDLNISLFYAIMVTVKNPPRAGACGSCEVEWVICGLRSDHNLDHLRLRTTWELWTLRHVKARFSDEKARKSTKKETKNRCFCVWELDAAGSSPVTSTTGSAGPQNRGLTLLIFSLSHDGGVSLWTLVLKWVSVGHSLFYFVDILVFMWYTVFTIFLKNMWYRHSHFRLLG